MKKLIFFLAVATVSVLFTGCSNELTDDGPNSVGTKAVITIPHNTIISTDTEWNGEYLLQGKVYVKAPAKLTIKAGSLIKGAYNSDPLLASALVVTRGAKIEAIGTESNPIVFTAQNGTKGGWGGIVVLGKAPINQVDQVIEGINTSVVPAGVDVYYGGGGAGLGTSNDNSGTLSYVRVEYAGARISDANELNAFTFGGVGSGTILNHLQAYYGADDAFEFFGGTVNAQYLVSTATDDDAFDFDFGYKGTIQFALATIDASMTYSSDPNGIECDNQGGNGPWPASPKTHPVLSNLTLRGTTNGTISGGGIGGKLKSAANFRRGTEFTLVNSVLYGFPTGALLQNINATPSPSSILKNNVISSTDAGKEIDGLTAAVDASGNSLVTPATIQLYTPWGNYKDVVALVPSGTPAISGAISIPGIVPVTYKGAFDPNDDAWTSKVWVK